MKDATVSAHVEYDVKNQAEEILRQIGVPVSVLINSLYRQIIFQGGIPFKLALPREPRAADAMSAPEVDAMLEHSYAQSVAGEGTPSTRPSRGSSEGSHRCGQSAEPTTIGRASGLRTMNSAMPRVGFIRPLLTSIAQTASSHVTTKSTSRLPSRHQNTSTSPA